MIGPRFPELLAAARGGDEQAFAVLWRDLQPAVLRYLQVAAGQAAEDLAADTWMAVIGGFGRFRGEERAFRAWMLTVARHRAIDWHRQARRRPTDSIPADRLSERPAPDDPVLEVLEAPSTRAALALVAEVARIVGKRPGTVRVLAHRGPRRLVERVEAAGLARGVTR